MPHIIISYRRSDSDVISGRIRDRLAGHYGNDSVFMDIDSIPFGLDFREHIKNALLENDMLLAIIGPHWTSGGAASPRILEETDPVRIEVETALQRGIPVIPVLVGGATMPQPAELPDSLKNLAYRNAAEVDGGRDFHQHMDRLIRSMDRLLAGKSTSPGRTLDTAAPRGANAAMRALPVPRAVLVGLAVVVLAIAGGLAYLAGTRTAAVQSPAQQPAGPPPVQQQIAQPTPRQAPTTTTATAPAPTATAPAPADDQAFPAAPPPCAKASSANAFYDDFKSHDIGWQPPVGTSYPSAGVLSAYAGGHLTITPTETMSYPLVYVSLIFSDVNVCVRVQNPPDDLKQAGLLAVGIVFWFQDFNNFYSAPLFFNPPSFQLYRKISQSWLTLSIVNTPQIKTEPAAINEIQIVTKGNLGAQYVNRTKVGEFKGQPPAKAPAGVIAQSGAQRRTKWEFLDFAVTENQ